MRRRLNPGTSKEEELCGKFKRRIELRSLVQLFTSAASLPSLPAIPGGNPLEPPCLRQSVACSGLYRTCRRLQCSFSSHLWRTVATNHISSFVGQSQSEFRRPIRSGALFSLPFGILLLSSCVGFASPTPELTFEQDGTQSHHHNARSEKLR